MPISTDAIFRDAADHRISWQEALASTVVIDDEGRIIQPTTPDEESRLQEKLHALLPYSKSSQDPLLNEIVRQLRNYKPLTS